MSIFESIEQLDGDHDAIAFPANASFQDIRHPEYPTDLAQIVRFLSAAKSQHTRATDHAQILDFAKARQDIVLNSVGEKCVLLIRTHVCERQHGDAFVAGAGESVFVNNNKGQERAEENGGSHPPLAPATFRSGQFANFLRRRRVADFTVVKTENANTDAVFHLAFAKVVKVWLPVARLGEVFGDA